jgi:hypothetical protein
VPIQHPPLCHCLSISFVGRIVDYLEFTKSFNHQFASNHPLYNIHFNVYINFLLPDNTKKHQQNKLYQHFIVW